MIRHLPPRCCAMMEDVGGYGYPVIDADGHGGEPLKWRRRIPDAFWSRIMTL